MCSFNCVAIHKIDMYLKIYIQINANKCKKYKTCFRARVFYFQELN